MIAECSPWGTACFADASFSDFLDDPLYFYNNMPISGGAVEILDRIFDMDPAARIALPALREAVLNVDTFFEERDDEADALGVHQSEPGQPAFPICGGTREPAVLRETLEIEETMEMTFEQKVDVRTLLDAEIPQAHTEVALPVLEEGKNYGGDESDGLVTPKCNFKLADAHMIAADASALVDALLYLSDNVKKPQKVNRKPLLHAFRNVQFYERLRLVAAA